MKKKIKSTEKSVRLRARTRDPKIIGNALTATSGARQLIMKAKKSVQ